MIDEAQLHDLLEAAADTFDVPADGEARILAAAAAPGDRPPRRVPGRRPRLAIGVAAALVAVAGVFIVGTVVGSHESTPASGRTGMGFAAGSAGASGSASVGTQGGGNAGPSVSNSASAGSAESASGTAGAGGSGPGLAAPAQPQPAPAPSVPAPGSDSAKVVKTGSVQLEVRTGAVSATMTRLTSLATGLGGYVADTKTAEGGNNPTGSVTLRVPVDTFENLVSTVRTLGTVQSLTTHGQDVTSQYTDIQARLTALMATRDQLLVILHRATAIGDVLAVQDRINDVQTQIDQLQGQQNVLDDQASYAALSVDVAQPGGTLTPPAPRTGLAKAWDDARHGFTNGVDAIVADSGRALLVLLILAALAVAARYGWLRLRRRLV